MKCKLQYKENHSIVATGHFAVDGADMKGHDNIVGGIESIGSNVISSLDDIDYWALGHIHRPQKLMKKEKTKDKVRFYVEKNSC